jgi:hypothetical protein
MTDIFMICCVQCLATFIESMIFLHDELMILSACICGILFFEQFACE